MPAICTAVFAALLWCAPALAGNTDQQAASNGTYTYDATALKGLLAKNVSNFRISAHGIARYIDATDAANIFIPFGSALDWTAFIGNAPASIYLDLARPASDLNIAAGNGTGIQFGPRLSFNDGTALPTIPVPSGGSNFYTVPAGKTGALDTGVSTIQPVSGNTPIARADTRNLTAVTAFRNLTETRTQAFTVKRDDCRHTVYPDSTTAEVCAPRSWAESITATFKYHLTVGGVTDTTADSAARSVLQTAAKNGSISGDFGTWGFDLSRAGDPPSFSAPANRSCGAYSNGQHYWVDESLQYDVTSCPAGYLSNPGNPYLRQWMLQRDYQCFDSKTQLGAYPTAPTREKPSSSTMIGQCLPIQNGTCAYNGSNFYGIGNPAALCAGGSITKALVFTGTGWTWGCAGGNVVSTSTTDNACSANLSVDGVMGPANGQSFPAAPTAANGLCGVSYTSPTVLGGDGSMANPWYWQCTGTNGGTPVTGVAYRAGWQVNGGSWNSTCSTNAYYTYTYGCYRADNTPLAGATCGGAPSGGYYGQNLTGCGYYAYGWGGWNYNSTCSDSATRTMYAGCMRTDGTAVGGAECTSRSVALSYSETVAEYSGCSYTPEVQTGWSACSGSSQSRTVYCRRSDGALVGGDACGYPGSTQSQSCMPTMYAGCRVETNGWDVMNDIAIDGGSGACYTQGKDISNGSGVAYNTNYENEVIVFYVGDELSNYNTYMASLYGGNENIALHNPGRYTINWSGCTPFGNYCIISSSGFDVWGNTNGHTPNGNYTVYVNITDNSTGITRYFDLNADKQTSVFTGGQGNYN